MIDKKEELKKAIKNNIHTNYITDDKNNNQFIKNMLMATDKVTLRDVYDAINELRAEVGKNYVTKDEFNPVRMIAYGLVSVILMSVIGALIIVVIRSPQEINQITNSIP